jgi:hypothetical protein
MTLLFDKVLRHRCQNDVHPLMPPNYDKFPAFERLDDHRQQVRAALWQFGGVITAAARYLRIDPARLRRFVHEIEPSLLEDIARIDAALTEYAQVAFDRGASNIAQGSNVSYIGKAKRHTALIWRFPPD